MIRQDAECRLAAWERVKRNRGSQIPGVDGETRRRIEEAGVERVLGDVRASLKDAVCGHCVTGHDHLLRATLGV